MRAFVQIRSNLAPLGKPQAYGIDENGNFSWLGECDITVDELFDGKPKQESQLDKAKRIISTALEKGAVTANEIFALTANEGISVRTVKQAKLLLNVHTFRRDNQWYWEIPIEVVYEEYREDKSEQECNCESIALLALNVA
jgi:hypothetical protein